MPNVVLVYPNIYIHTRDNANASTNTTRHTATALVATAITRTTMNTVGPVVIRIPMAIHVASHRQHLPYYQ